MFLKSIASEAIIEIMFINNEKLNKKIKQTYSNCNNKVQIF